MDTFAASNEDINALHQSLVDKLKLAGHIQSPEVEAAFRVVPRHLFVPDAVIDEVYRDQVIPIKRLGEEFISASSQPTIMAIMLEQLDLRQGQRVLEIGAGSGYNAALIAHIVGESGLVVTVDIDEDIVESAREHLETVGLRRVQVVCGDGGLGYAAAAPYDRIILTVKAWDIAPAWFEQLKPGGKLLVPLTIIQETPKLVTFERIQDVLESSSVEDCEFISLRGAFAGPQNYIQIGPEQGLYFVVENPHSVDTSMVYQLLTGPGRDWSTQFETTLHEVWSGLSLWLALHERCFCSISAYGSLARSEIVPPLLAFSEMFNRTIGLFEGKSLCVLMRDPDQARSIDVPANPTTIKLWIRSFGADETLAHRLNEQVKAWETAGRPTNKGLGIRAYPMDSTCVSLKNEIVIPKRWMRLVINWQ